MSLVTGCPACSTMFKVVPDQLRISHGWVRCGHCSEVFDAAANLQPRALSSGILSAAQPPAVPDDAGTEPALVPSAVVESAEPTEIAGILGASDTFSPVGGGTSQVDALLNKPLPDLPRTELVVAQRPVEPRPIWRSSAKPVAANASTPDSEPFELHSRFYDSPESSVSHESAAERHAVEPLEPPVSFVRAARRQAFWRRSGVRLVLSALLLVALAAWALQVAHHERNRLAALYPQTRPWLVQMCEHLRCTVSPLQQIESIVIDSSSFNKMQGGSYRLSLSLKNQSALPLAMPSVELTLTDAQDQPVLRRVLQPADLGSKTAVIDAGGIWSNTQVISVAADGATPETAPDSSRIAGYRVLAFYP